MTFKADTPIPPSFVSLSEKQLGSMGDRILDRRRRLDLSQVDLARRAGLRRDRLSRFENGRATPSLPEALALCQALSIGLDELVVGTASAGAEEQARFPQLSEIARLGNPDEIGALQRLLSLLVLGYRVNQDLSPDKSVPKCGGGQP